MILSFRIVRHELPYVSLILVGRGLETGPGEQWAIRNRLNDGIEFRGYIPHPNIVKLLQSEANILVHPSRSEGFGMTLVEALASGVSVIANQAGAMPWVLDEGKAGLLINAENPSESASAMTRMVKDDEMRKKLTRYGYQMVRRRFDPHEIARTHLHYYRDILREENR